jgi:CheY-like chemotaxis protein
MSASLLVVEDNDDLVLLYSTAFSPFGYTIHEARSTAEAIGVLQTVTPTLVILDIEMPDALGNRVINHIRSDSRFGETKIVIVTANDIYQNKLGDMVDGFFVKPINVAELIQSVNTLTGHKVG